MRDPRMYGIPLGQRPPSTYWSFSPRTKIVRLLGRHGWSRVDDVRQAALVWGRTPEKIDWGALRPEQLVDWVRGTELIADKGWLFRVLHAAGAAGLQPETFLIEATEELERFRARARELPDAVWIKKPTNRGSGIGVEVVSDAEAFCRSYGQAGEAGSDPVLMQRYIDNPLLLDGTKSEIRSYFLIASVEPLLVFFHDGTLRLSLRPYERGQWDDPLRHINNTARQKRADPELYKARSHQLKWTLGQLECDLRARRLTRRFDYVDTVLRPRLKAIVAGVMRAVQPRLERRPGSFQLLGMDCILADDLRTVWLTEVQRGPGLSADDPVKAHLVPAMLEEALEIVLEVNDRRRAGTGLRELESPRSFQWLINDAIEGVDARGPRTSRGGSVEGTAPSVSC